MAVLIDSNSRFVAFVSTFTALAVVLDSIPIIPGFYSGVWNSWIFMISPIFGIILGPIIGATSIALGSFIGHLIYFRDPFEFLFMFGAPLGAGISGLVFQKQWKPVLAIYSFLLAGYFLTPVSWQLPLWGVWDILVGFGILLIFSIICSMKIWERIRNKEDFLKLVFAAVIGLEMDILFRVFILVPGQTYWFFYGLSVEGLQTLWWGAGIVTPLKVLIAVIFGLIVGIPLLKIVRNESNPVYSD